MKLFVWILVCSCYASNVYAALTYQDCSKGKNIATIHEFSLSPDPVSLSKDIRATVNITLHEDIPPNSLVKNRIHKLTNLFGLPISVPAPCMGGVGSCTTASCEYLNAMKQQVCAFVPSDLKCDCPLKAGQYGGKDIIIPIPELSAVAKFLASGKFELEWRMVKKEDSTEKEIICFKINLKTVP